MAVAWTETAKGPALNITVDGRFVSFYPYELENPERVAAQAAVSLWEGIAGLLPHGRFARWRWRRGLRKLQNQIAKEVRLATTE